MSDETDVRHTADCCTCAVVASFNTPDERDMWLAKHIGHSTNVYLERRP